MNIQKIIDIVDTTVIMIIQNGFWAEYYRDEIDDSVVMRVRCTKGMLEDVVSTLEDLANYITLIHKVNSVDQESIIDIATYLVKHTASDKKYGESIAESLSGDFVKLEEIAAATVAAKSDVLIEEEVQSPRLTAVDVAEHLREHLDKVVCGSMQPDIALHYLKQVITWYDQGVQEGAIELKNLTQTQADDKTIQAMGHKYDMTLNQVVGYLDICHQLNNDHGLKDCGVVAVPFWFHSQFLDIQAMNKQLIKESEILMDTFTKIQEKAPDTLEAHGIAIPVRKSIITGVNQVYIPGETGPRLGHEHLDKDNVYLNDTVKQIANLDT